MILFHQLLYCIYLRYYIDYHLFLLCKFDNLLMVWIQFLQVLIVFDLYLNQQLRDCYNLLYLLHLNYIFLQYYIDYHQILQYKLYNLLVRLEFLFVVFLEFDLYLINYLLNYLLLLIALQLCYIFQLYSKGYLQIQFLCNIFKCKYNIYLFILIDINFFN